MNGHRFPALAALALLALLPGAARADEVREVDLPVRDVTVFSDRARVLRRGEVPLEGSVRVRLPTLPPTLDPGSVRLEAEGAKVDRIEIRRALKDELPRSKAERLVDELEKGYDARAALVDRVQNLERERELLQGLRPASEPRADPKGAVFLLETAGWKSALAYFDARAQAANDALRALEAQRTVFDKKLAVLAAEAAQLAAGATGDPGWIVEALLAGGEGRARLSLAYVALNARWIPAYDVRYVPGRSEVEVDFAGLVSQQTGEDWTDARLVLSTAVPATTVSLPRLMSWRIGEKDQLIPTPVAKADPPPPPPPPVVRGPLADAPAARDEALRRRLRELARAAPAVPDLAKTQMFRFEDDSIAGELVKPEADYGEFKKKDRPAPAPPPRPSSSKPSKRAAPPAAPSEATAGPMEEMALQSRAFGAQAAPSDVPVASAPAPGEPPTSVAFGAPRGWVAPSYAADLPAALAGGYDFTYPSARAETVRSGAEARRVALHAARFPASASLSIFPALKKHAYLVTEVTNTSDRPLLRGQANLYVGADLQGQARIETTATGEKVTLPLGVDEGIQIERQVNLSTREKGLVSKDDVTAYEVVIELMNPRQASVDAKIVDQIPLKGDQHVEVKLEKMDPWAIEMKEEGTLEWHLTLKPGAKQVIRFSFLVTRPKGAKLRQW